MSKDSEAIDRVFRLHEEAKQARSQSMDLSEFHVGTSKLSREEQDWADARQVEAETPPAGRYRPIQHRDDRRTGCLGGLMYAVFVMCISIILACLGWMAASDMLALNKESYTATIVLPENIFSTEIVEETDEEGNVISRSTVRRADISYISGVLKQAGLIEYRWLFESFCRIAHADEKVKPGEYHLQSTYDYRALIQNMRPNAGGAVTVNVTLIEGMTMHDMFVTLERSGVTSFEDLNAAAADYSFRHSFLPEGEEGDPRRLEGYLFPETYNFYANMQASSTIIRLLDQFESLLTDEVQSRIAESGRSLQELVNVASMIEKEAADDDERALIASVIYNRLAASMPLGIDATILYVHPEHDGAPTAEMLKEQSPYNTRLYTGLPPTPICNPGRASLEAALSPAQTDYYYYALDTETGRHRFFNSQGEFDAFVATQNYA